MTGSTISSTVKATVTIGTGGYESPLTITRTGEIAPSLYSTDAIDAPAGLGSVSITNHGRIFAAGGSFAYGTRGGIGINLLAAATVSNSGLIVGGYGAYEGFIHGVGGAGIYLGAGGIVENSGTIFGGSSTGYRAYYCGDGLNFATGGTLINSGTVEGGESRADAGVSVVFGKPGVLSNTGLIEGARGFTKASASRGYQGYDGGIAVAAASGNTLTNQGTIEGGAAGGLLTRGSGTIVPGAGGTGISLGVSSVLTNTGSILGGIGGEGSYGGNGGIGLRLGGAGISNNTGVITGGIGGYSYTVGGTGGVGIDMSGGTLTNKGVISGGAGGAAGLGYFGPGTGGNGGAGVYINGGTLMDTGTISGGAAGVGPGGTGVTGDAVLFGTLAGELMLQANAVLNGAVVANATADDVLILAGKSAGTIASSVTGFTNLQERANAHWIVTSELQASTITLAGGILTDSATGTIIAGASGTAEAGTILVTQDGTIIGSGTISAGQVIDNGNAKIDAHGGTLTVKGSLSGSGTVRIDSNATLVEKGMLSVTHVAFGLNGDAHLVVTKPIPLGPPAPIFYAFGVGDTIDLQNLQADALNFANGTLTLEDSGVKVDTLLFSGDYSSANFTLTSDGGGGTTISYKSDMPHVPHFAFLQHW